MYKRVAAILLPIFAVALVAVGAWGYQESQDKDSVLLKAENQYQRAFHELNFHMNKLQDELGKSLALNSRKQVSTSMTNVWRLAYSAENNVGQLPLSMMPFNETQNFLYNVGNFSYQIGVRDLNKEPMTAKEWDTLQTLYKRSHEVRGHLEKLQTQVLKKNLRWMDVEMAMGTEDNKMDNAIIDGFKKVNTTVNQYPEVDWGPTVNSKLVRRKEKIQHLQGKKITAEEAKARVAKLLDRTTVGMDVTHNKKGDYPTYSVHFIGKNKTDVNADVTTIGGHIIWMVYDRDVKTAKLNLNQAEAIGKRFLDKGGYKDMVPISYQETGNVMGINFVHVEDKIHIYPEAVSVKVALDNGEITGFQATDYVFNILNRMKPSPTLTEAQARKKVSTHLNVKKSNLAIIYNTVGKEVLCYEFLGLLGKEEYRVFINADTGDEEFIEKISKADADQI